MKEMKISIPEGMVVDTENSSLETGVIKFKRKELTLLEKVEEYIRGKFVYSRDYGNFKCEKVFSYTYIKIPLPNSNEEWTFQAFKACEEICKELKDAYPSFPKNKENFDCSRFLYIHVLDI